MRLIGFCILAILSVAGSLFADVDGILSWMFGVNFTLSIFSINFTFFGHQLPKYKALYDEISARQWLSISVVLGLPFAPLLTYLFFPQYIGNVALGVLPLIAFSAFDNALMTRRYLSPVWFVDNKFTDNSVKSYLFQLSSIVKEEVKIHENYLENRKSFQIPMHASRFEPTSLGCDQDDMWDSVVTIVKLSIENNDHATFRRSVDVTLKLLIEFYTFGYDEPDNFRLNGGIKSIGRRRLSALVNYVKSVDKEGFFLNTLSNELCRFLLSEKILNQPCSEMALAIVSDLVLPGKTMIESKNSINPIKTVNTLHSVQELTLKKIHAMNEGNQSELSYNIQMYARFIKQLATHSFKNDALDLAHRCMESLSYLGCNAAKQKSQDTVEVTLDSLSQLGREARSFGIDCFWSRCLVPVESHAEEFMGHILTWLVRDLDSSVIFYESLRRASIFEDKRSAM